MDVKTIILVSIGVIVVAAMIFIILKDSYFKTGQANNTSGSTHDEMIIDDQSESNYETIDGNSGMGGDGGDESIYESI